MHSMGTFCVALLHQCLLNSHCYCTIIRPTFLSFFLKPLIPPHHTSLYTLASYQLQSSFQYPSPKVYFPLSIIIPSQSSLFGAHLSSPSPSLGALFLKSLSSFWPDWRTQATSPISPVLFSQWFFYFSCLIISASPDWSPVTPLQWSCDILSRPSPFFKLAALCID